jgi:hypothetical protein
MTGIPGLEAAFGRLSENRVPVGHQTRIADRRMVAGQPWVTFSYSASSLGRFENLEDRRRSQARVTRRS